jgi:uncharacterized membrane protein
VPLAISAYQWMLFAHLLMTVVWVGGGLMIQVFAFRILRADDPVRLAGFAKDVEWIGSRVLMPSSLVLLVFGFALVYEGDWGYPFWVVWGLVVLGLSAVAGAGFLGPESGRIGKLVEAHGVEHPEVGRRIRRILAYSRVELVLLVSVVFVMTAKPFG